MLGLSGGVLGVRCRAIGLRPFVVFWPGSLPRAEEVRLDWHVLLFAARPSLLSGLLFGLVPRPCALPPATWNTRFVPVARTTGGNFAPSAQRLCGFRDRTGGGAAGLGRNARATLLRLSSLDPGVNVHNVLAARVALPPLAQLSR